MEHEKKVAPVETAMDKAIADRAKIEKLKASTQEEETKASEQLRRSLELSASFHEKLAALNAGSIALAVSVGVALVSKATPHSAFLRSNLNWLVIIAFLLWLSLMCAFGHNALFIKVARLEWEKAEDWSKWIGLINASAMQSVAGNREIAQPLDKLIADTIHDRGRKRAVNEHRTEQTILRARVLGRVAVDTFLIAYTLVFVCIVRIWWAAR